MANSKKSATPWVYCRLVDKITPELRAQMQSMSSAGMTAKQIAEQTCLSYWTVRRRLTQWGCSNTQLDRKKKDKRVKELYDTGLSDVQIAKELGLRPSSIALSRKRLNLKRKTPGIKLIPSEVQELESMFQRDVPASEIASYFGLHLSSVYWRKRRWQKQKEKTKAETKGKKK